MKTIKKIFRITIFTTLPEIYPGILGSSVLGNSLKKGLWKLKIINIKKNINKKKIQIDDKTYYLVLENYIYGRI